MTKKNKNKKSSKESKKKSNKKLVVKEKISTTKRKWIEKDSQDKVKKYKTGKITPEEEEIIIKALCKYGSENSLTKENLLDLINEKKSKEDKSVWTKIAENLPDRNVQSIHNYCRRKFNPLNYKGRWSEEEEKYLIQLVENYGNKWEKISEKIGRTANNCKDKYKSLSNAKHSKINREENTTSLCKYLKLLKEINNSVDKKYNFLPKIYKFREDFKGEDLYQIVKEEEDKFIIDKQFKETPSKIIIKNVLRKLLDLNNLKLLFDDKVEIPWNVISSKLEFYSIDMCRNQFRKIINYFEIESGLTNKRDIKMLQKIIEHGFESIEDINWPLIKNKRSTTDNIERLKILNKTYNPFGVKEFIVFLNKAKEDLMNNNMFSEDDKEDLKSEIKKIKRYNLANIYENYLLEHGIKM